MTTTTSLPLKIQDIILGLGKPIAIKSIDVEGVELNTSIGPRYISGEPPCIACDTAIHIMTAVTLKYDAGFDVACNIAYTGMPIFHGEKTSLSFDDLVEIVENGVFQVCAFNDLLNDDMSENIGIYTMSEDMTTTLQDAKLGSIENAFDLGHSRVLLDETNALNAAQTVEYLLNNTDKAKGMPISAALSENVDTQIKAKAIAFLQRKLIM